MSATASRNDLRQGTAGSLSLRVYAAIEEMIMSGELRGGDRVNEIALSEAFGTSRGPLREACRALTQEGLLVAIPNRGVFVRELDLKEALEVYDIRAELDGLIGRQVAICANDDELDSLRILARRMEEAAAAGDLARYYPLNLEFHDKLLIYARNSRLKRLYQSLIKELHLFRRKGLLHGGSMRISNEEHGRIVAAIESRDPIEAGLTMRNHVLAAKHRLLAAVEAERQRQNDDITSTAR